MIKGKRVIKSLKHSFIVFICLIIVSIFFILPRINIAGAMDVGAPFPFDDSLTIEKKLPDETTFTINNSSATFALDIAGKKRHCKKIFKDYADAIKYCRSNNLNVIPSVQMVQGKLKQFDDELVAAVELIVNDGFPARGLTGKQKALQQLLEGLERQSELCPNCSSALEAAIVYVAAAIELGGWENDLAPGLRDKVDKVKKRNSDLLNPIGLWAETEELQRIYKRDRFLMKGKKISRAEMPAVIAMTFVLMNNDDLSENFSRFRQIDAKLTNPPVFINQDAVMAQQARSLSFKDVASMLPAEASLEELLEPSSVDETISKIHKKYGEDSGFALVSFSESKEYEMLLRIMADEGATGSRPTISAILDYIKSGRIKLEPKPESGWYDYQWYAMEPLVLFDKTRESRKLKLSDLYRKRLEMAFMTSLAKHRETHIKRLPEIFLGIFDKPPLKVKIAPEFSAEPLPTVYLRYARAYRFILGALRETLGEDVLKEMRENAAAAEIHGKDMLSELQRTMMLCYGLYQRICRETGLIYEYELGEMTPEEILQAEAVVSDWIESLEDDPAMSKDSRFSSPVFWDPDRNVHRYWASGGIKLERVVYRYIEKPRVNGNVDPKFMAAYYYLPTDVFLEFERPGPALTREEFRKLCDGYDNETALKAGLGDLVEGNISPLSKLLKTLIFVLAVCMVVVLAFRFRDKLKNAEWKKYLKYSFDTVLLLIFLFFVLMIASPYYRTQVIVRYLATRGGNLGLQCEGYVGNTVSSGSATALAEMLGDPDPQIRYLAANFIYHSGIYNMSKKLEYPQLTNALVEAVDDEVVDVGSLAISAIANREEPKDITFLIPLLEKNKDKDFLCGNIIYALGRTSNPEIVDALIPFTEDPRQEIRENAIWAIFIVDYNYKSLEVLSRLAIKDPYKKDLHKIFDGIRYMKSHRIHTEDLKSIDNIVIQGVHDRNLSFDRRLILLAILSSNNSVLEEFDGLLNQENGENEEKAFKVIVENQKLLSTVENELPVSLLGRLIERSNKFLFETAALLQYEDPGVRVLAVETLSQLPSRLEEVAPQIRQALESGNIEDRLAAAALMVKAGYQMEKAVPVLINILESEDSRFHRQALSLLGQAGSSAKDAVPVLKKLISRTDYPLDFLAEETLKKIEE